jgi:ATP-dependent DNA ligase
MLVPQLAKQAEVTSLEQFIKDERWVMEQKLDGHRLLLVSPGMDMPPTAITRNGTIYTRNLPRAIQDFRFPEGEWALDGELVGSTFWVFDIPLAPNDAADGAALWARRMMLESLLADIRHPFRLVPQAKSPEQKIALASRALDECFEGLLLKRADSPYRSGGRTDEWLKVKFVATADCIVLGVRDDGKDSVRLGLCGPEGDLRAVQDVGRASLIGKEKRGPIQLGDVLEVRYLYCGAGGRLFQPTVLRKRTDKRPDECTIDQLKHVNKEVLEAL